jgi:hypothetical protein
VLQARQQQE